MCGWTQASANCPNQQPVGPKKEKEAEKEKQDEKAAARREKSGLAKNFHQETKMPRKTGWGGEEEEEI